MKVLVSWFVLYIVVIMLFDLFLHEYKQTKRLNWIKNKFNSLSYGLCDFHF